MANELVLIDDDTEVLQINHKFFQKKGYQVHSFSSAKKALCYLRENHAECIVTDIMMPDLNGYELCKELKQFSETPIIFLTGKTSEDEKIQGLLLGAEDYVTKPYSLRELEARIIVQMRKNKKMTSENTLTVSSISIDLVKHMVYYQNTNEIILAKREFECLVYLAKHVGEIVSFEDLGMNMWGRYTENDRRVVMVNVSRLRKKLNDVTGNDHMIETVWSVGYKLIG